MDGYRLGALAHIFGNPDEVHLCPRNDLDIWNLPGGGKRRRASPWRAVVREVEEATGLKVQVERLAGVYSLSCQPSANKKLRGRRADQRA